MLKAVELDDLEELLHTASMKPVKKGKKGGKSDKKIAKSNVSDSTKGVSVATPMTREMEVNAVDTVMKVVSQHDGTHDIVQLKDMYNELKNVGILDAEKRFDEFKTASDGQIKVLVETLEDRIKILEKSNASAVSTEDVELEIQAVKEQVKASLMEQMQVAETEKDSLAAMLKEANETNQNLVNEIKRLKSDVNVNIQVDTDRMKDGMLNLFQGLSGLSILHAEQHSSDENVFVFTCYLKGSRGDLLFKIAANIQMDGSSSVEYIPCLEMEIFGHKTCADIVEHLPDYLTEEIEFGENMLSQFFIRMVSYLNSL